MTDKKTDEIVEEQIIEVPKAAAPKPVAFFKQQILEDATHGAHRDILSVLLKEDTTYTQKQIDKLLKDYLEGKVK